MGHFSMHDDNVLNSHAALRWKLSAISSEEFSALLGIVNSAQRLTGNKPNLQSMQLHSSGSSENMSWSYRGKQRRPQEM